MDKNSEEYKISKQISDAIAGNGTINAAVERAAAHVRSYSPEDASYILSDPDWNETVRRAQEMLQKTYINNRKNMPSKSQSSEPKKITKGQSAQATIEILNDPEKYGLTTEQVAEAAWFIAGTPDELVVTDDDRKKIKERLLKEKEENALRTAKESLSKNENIDSISARFGRARKKARTGVSLSDEELETAILLERKNRTVEYLQKNLEDENWKKSSSNSLGELYEIELGMASLASGVASGKITDEAKAKLTTYISGKLPEVGGVLKAGEGARFFSDPSSYLSSKVGSKVGAAVSAKIAALAAGKLAGTALGAALGTIAPVIGNIAGYFAGQAIGKYISSAISKSKKFLAALGGIIAIGLLEGMVIVGGAVGGITIILVPIVAFIVFIINASGYVVPPSSTIPGGGGIGSMDPNPGVKENPYIRVTKVPNPSGPFANSQLPFSVEYTITIAAKTTTPLTNISFKYGCQVTGQTQNLGCPIITPAIPTPPAEITDKTPFVIRYSASYTSPYNNSIVMDSLAVTADVGAVKGTSASGFAAIQIGTPPLGCFTFAGTWPAREKTTMTAAIGQILVAKTYVSTICKPELGTINLKYSPIQDYFNGKPYGGITANPNITFFPLGVGNIYSAFYTLAHESGHIFAARTDVMTKFLDDPNVIPKEGFICTYPLNQRGSEDFAENIALYLAGQSLSSDTRDFTCMTGGNLRTRYPLHWQFAHDNVFKENLRW